MENKDSIVQKLINVVHPETGLLLTNINLQTKLGWTALILAIRNNKDTALCPQAIFIHFLVDFGLLFFYEAIHPFILDDRFESECSLCRGTV